MHDDSPSKRSTPAEKVMKQTSKTASELSDKSVRENEDEDPVGPNDGPTVDHGKSVSDGALPIANGDGNVDTTGNPVTSNKK